MLVDVGEAVPHDDEAEDGEGEVDHDQQCENESHNPRAGDGRGVAAPPVAADLLSHLARHRYLRASENTFLRRAANTTF